MHSKGVRHTRVKPTSRLKPLDHRAVRRHPIHIGGWFLLILSLGAAAIIIWTFAQIHSGSDPVSSVSIGAAALAAYSVSMLGLIALINFTSWLFHVDYLWVLPTDFADIPLDWPIAVAVVVGLALGWRYWQ